MGCFLSTSKSKKQPQIPISKHSISKSPPPTNPLPEEETVKEVLSETPTAPPLLRRKNDSPFIKTAPLLLQDNKPYMAFTRDDNLSEVSEICSSLSESVSASIEKRENGDRREELVELRRRSRARLNNRSFSGEVHREKTTVGRSPGRSLEPSPCRVRPVPGPGSGYGRRRESGESSGRRSRSPVTRAESGPSKPGQGRTQLVRKTGKSPGRVGSGLGERIRKADGGKESGDNKWPPTSNESLENPLVSLECFIFL